MWTDLFQRGWVRKNVILVWWSSCLFSVFCTTVQSKEQSKMCSHFSATTEILRNFRPVDLQFGPALLFISQPVQLEREKERGRERERGKEPLRKKGFCPTPSQVKSTSSKRLILVAISQKLLLLKIACPSESVEKKNPETLPTTFLWTGWLKWCVQTPEKS